MPAFITTFILPLLLYSFSAATTASGYADSDELITMGHLFGVAHPSGYPMAVTLTGIFMRLLFFLPPAHAANLLAALVQAGFVYLLYRVFKLIILLLPTRPSSPLFSSPTLDFLAQALALLTGVSSLFWLYGSVIEVVSFTNLLTISVIFSALSWYRLTLAGRHHSPSFYATWVLTGLGLAHIHTFVLLLPGLLILLIFGFKHLPSATLRFPRIILYGLSAAAVSFPIPNLILFF